MERRKKREIRLNLSKRVLANVRIGLLYVLVILVGLSYHPIVFNISHSSGINSGTLLSPYILAVFIALFLFSFSFSCFCSKLIKTFVISTIVIAITALLVYSVFNNTKMINEAKSIALCLVAVMIGWSIFQSGVKIEKVLLLYSIVILASSLLQVLYNIGGFQIEDVYLVNAKNSLGALLGTSIISCISLFLSSDSRIHKLFYLLLVIFGLVLVLTIRARGALLSVLLVSFLLCYVVIKNRSFWVFVICLLAILFLVFPILPDQITAYVYNSIFSGSQGVDVSSGRFDQYKSALAFLNTGNNLFIGDIYQKYDVWIHNYVLLQVYNFGILFSIPILVFYCYLLVSLFRKGLHSSPSASDCGFALVIHLFMISLFEPTFPFSPGSVTLYNFIILGMSLSRSYNFAPVR